LAAQFTPLPKKEDIAASILIYFQCYKDEKTKIYIYKSFVWT